jgi:Na+:H+ antiporter, NhaC family
MEFDPPIPLSAPKRPVRLVHSLATLGGAALLLGIGYGVFRIKVEILLVASTALASGMAVWLGLGWREIQAGMLQSILKGMPAMLIVVVVGALIGSWIAAGIIPMVIYYGLGLISPHSFLLTASVAACVMSMLTGTGYGTIGTIGVAFMGIAHGLGVPAGEAAGAVVAGAYLGDKISPFAANANLAVAVCRANLYDHITHSLWTTVPALLVGFLVYAGLGAGAVSVGAGTLAGSAALRAALAGTFVFSPWLLLPPAVIIYSMARRRPVIPGMLLSAVAATVLAIAVQHVPLAAAVNAMVDGYAPHTGLPAVDQLLAQGGMAAMMHVTLIALCAFAFSGVLQKAGLLAPLLHQLLRFASTPGRLILTTGVACVAVEMITGSAFLCIIIPAELFAPAYSRLNLAAKNLSRTIGDCGIVGVPLIPWSIAGAFVSGTLGVRVGEYAPWAVFCYAGIVITIVAGFSGFAIAKRKFEDETQVGS